MTGQERLAIILHRRKLWLRCCYAAFPQHRNPDSRSAKFFGEIFFANSASGVAEFMQSGGSALARAAFGKDIAGGDDMSDEQRIRERAHAIWEAEGRPPGRDKEHWQRACRELGIHVVAGDPGQGGPITPISGAFAQEEPPYAGTDPNAERTG